MNKKFKKNINRRPGIGFEKRFWSTVKKGKKNECWLWLGGPGCRGYGSISTDPVGDNIRGVSLRANRASWIIHYGKISNNLFVLHKCDNPSCVNPNHLWLGTQAQNMADMRIKKRDSRGEKHPLSKINKKVVIKILSEKRTKRGDIKKIAEKYDVQESQVRQIRQGDVWKEIYAEYVSKYGPVIDKWRQWKPVND